MNRPAYHQLWLGTLVAGLAAILAACESSAPKQSFEIPREASPAPEAPAPAATVLARDPWSFGSTTGVAITTRSYRIYSTSKGVAPVRLPSFVEAALLHYRTAITPLSAPTDRLETFVLANRSEWIRCVQMIWGERAEPYLTIQRGGVAAGGKSVLYDIGPRDTLVLAAHEGWHQFAQATFKEQLPAWLDEGIAAYMEGFRSESGSDRFTFLPWANTERFDRLRDASGAGALRSLRELIESSPARQLSASSGDALTWYAQVWVLVHWLREGDGAQRNTRLRELVADAAAGRLLAHVEETIGPRAAVNVRQKRPGPEVFFAYFDRSMDAADASYQAFIKQVVAIGSREKIVAGRSPIAP